MSRPGGRSSCQLPEAAQIARVSAMLEKWGVPIRGSLKESVEKTRKSVRGILQRDRGIAQSRFLVAWLLGMTTKERRGAGGVNLLQQGHDEDWICSQ